MSSGGDRAGASIASLAAELERRAPAVHRVALEFDGWSVELLSNTAEVTDWVASYLSLFAADRDACDETVHVYDLDLDLAVRSLELTDWARPPGKSLKEQVADVGGGWIVHKVRTGMSFALGSGRRLAFGPSVANRIQVVNFINALFMSARIREGWTLCHASAVAVSGPAAGVGVGMAGISGAGKSTLALHAMSRELSFVTNDRLLIRTGEPPEMVGVPKHPRINPGTALGNPTLSRVLEPARRAELEGMDREALWDLEEKYDADIGELYGGRWVERAALAGFVLLNWRRGSSDPAAARRVEIADRPDLWPALLKTPGPLHVGAGERRSSNSLDVDPDPYVAILSRVPVVEITGRIDFELAVDQVLSLLGRG